MEYTLLYSKRVYEHKKSLKYTHGLILFYRKNKLKKQAPHDNLL